MITSYLIIAWRNLLKNRLHAFVNIGGLAIGFATCLLIALYIGDELSFDHYNGNADRIERVVSTEYATTPAALAPSLQLSYPNLIDKTARLWPVFAPAKMRHDDIVFVETGVVFADAAVLSMFTWPLISGNPAKALTEKNSIVLTSRMAKKYFANADPIGQHMKFWGSDLTVTAVMENIPPNSHLKFDFLVSFPTLEMVMGNGLDERWDMPAFYSYLLLKENVTPREANTAVQNIVRLHADTTSRLQLQSLKSIHLESRLKAEFQPGGNMSYIYILGAAAFLILVLASANFANLKTALATTRIREVGMRKTLGALRRQLIEQFLGESLVTCVIAWMLAIAAASFVMPVFNQFTGKSILWQNMLSLTAVGASIVVIMVVSFFAAFYPAMFLAKLKPVSSLKGIGGAQISNNTIKQGLVVLQFMISTLFLTSMVIVLLQLDFLLNKDLGFEKEQVIVLDGDGFPMLKKELNTLAGVDEVSGVPQVFPGVLPSSPYQAEGIDFDSTHLMSYYGVTPGFIETMQIKLIAGKSFTEDSQKDNDEAFVLNESAARESGWSPQEAIGKSFSMRVPPIDGGDEVWRKGFVTGVVRDFNFDLLYKEVTPLVMYPSRDLNLTFVRLKGSNDVINGVQNIWKKVNPDAPFNYYFLDDRIRQQYEAESKLSALMSVATVLAIIIACLGLAGVVSFSAQQRSKEIGVRKVFGASTQQVIGILTWDFVKLIALASLITLPLAYFAVKEWVSGFAYHIDLSWTIFITTGAVTIIVGMITAVLQSLSTATQRPTDSLRAE